jgi:hypothetical protein
MGVVVGQIARGLRVPAGFENARDCPLSPRGEAGTDGHSKDINGLSIRQALDELMTFMPGFSWREVEGVLVVRPNSEWENRQNVLSLPTSAFSRTGQPIGEILHTVLEATLPRASVSHVDVPRPERPIDRPITLVFAGGTMLEALNALSRAHGNVDWQIGYAAGPNRATIQFGAFDFNGGTIAAPVALPEPKVGGNVPPQFTRPVESLGAHGR